MVEWSGDWFQSETHLAKIATIMATIVEIRKGLSEDSSLSAKVNLALERLGQLANGEIKVEGSKVKLGEVRPWSPRDSPLHAAILELYEDHEWAYAGRRSEFPDEVWTTLQACTFAEFLVEHPEALALRIQRIEREMGHRERGSQVDPSKQDDKPSSE